MIAMRMWRLLQMQELWIRGIQTLIMEAKIRAEVLVKVKIVETGLLIN
jgi:hypothetical protein